MINFINHKTRKKNYNKTNLCISMDLLPLQFSLFLFQNYPALLSIPISVLDYAFYTTFLPTLLGDEVFGVPH